HEFYRERAEITKRLIKEKSFTAVAVEADWPDAYRVNRYVRGVGDDIDAGEALSDFRRFPTWMWRNTQIVEFIEWLRAHNNALAPGASALLCARSHSMNSTIWVLRHIHVGKRRKSESASPASMSSPTPRT